MKFFSPNNRRQSLGFSIVELMVAILIGLIILAGVIQVVMTSKSTFLGQEEMSFIQENARYAMDVIGKDIQGAGYLGCAGNEADVALVARVGADAADFLGPESVVGFEGDGVATTAYPAAYKDKILAVKEPASTTAQDYPDSFIVRRAEGVPVGVTAQTDFTFTLQDPHEFSVGSYIAVVAEDCRRVGIVRASAVADSQFSVSGASICGNLMKPQLDNDLICDAACNCDGEGVNQVYLPGSTAMAYSAHAYYVADSAVMPGTPALKRMALHDGAGTEEELALGVEDMEVVYGVVDGSNIRYFKASDISADQWPAVVAVQVNLLLRSQAPSLVQAEARPYLSNDYNDRFMRQVVTSTFRLRNRI